MNGGAISVTTGAAAEMHGVDKLDKEALVLLSGHEKEVYACSWNPTTNVLVSGSSDSTARLWTLPNKVEDEKSMVHKILDHGSGPHKDVTTLEWNVRVHPFSLSCERLDIPTLETDLTSIVAQWMFVSVRNIQRQDTDMGCGRRDEAHVPVPQWTSICYSVEQD